MEKKFQKSMIFHMLGHGNLDVELSGFQIKNLFSIHWMIKII